MWTRSWLVLLALAAGACNQPQFGSGIGRPDAPIVVRPALLELAVTEVFAGLPPPAGAFVELLATGDEDVTLDGLWLCSERAACVELTGSLATRTRLAVDAAALGLAPSYGQVAVVDADLTTNPASVAHTSLAWGGDPAPDAPLTALTLSSGLQPVGGEAFVRLPYPLPTGVAVAQEGILAGCAAPTPDNAAQLDPGLCPVLAPVLRLTEVSVAESWIELRNLSAGDLSLYGVRVCQPPSCAAFGADEAVVPAGAVIQVYLGGGAPANERVLATAAPLRAAGEVAVLAPGPSQVEDAAALQSIVVYGAASPNLAHAADVACLWPDPSEAAPAPSETDVQESLTVVAADVGAASWQLAPKSPEVDAAPLPTPTQGPASPLVVSRLDRGRQTLALRNDSGAALALSDYNVELNGAEPLALASLGLPDLAAGASLTLGLGDACRAVPCWPSAGLEATGEIVVRDGATLLQYVQWGALVGANAQEATDLGLWPAPWCAAPALDAEERLTLSPGAIGQRPLDYQ